MAQAHVTHVWPMSSFEHSRHGQGQGSLVSLLRVLQLICKCVGGRDDIIPWTLCNKSVAATYGPPRWLQITFTEFNSFSKAKSSTELVTEGATALQHQTPFLPQTYLFDHFTDSICDCTSLGRTPEYHKPKNFLLAPLAALFLYRLTQFSKS